MIVKSIIFFGRSATHACDGRCDKAWGINSRPSVPSRAERGKQENPDDYAYLADDELGTAPIDPGTYEGECAKPHEARGPEDINKWCVRECERAWMSPPDQPNAEPDLPDFSERFYNIRPHRRASNNDDPAKAKPPVEQLVRSLEPAQAQELVRSLEPVQVQKLTELMAAQLVRIAEASGGRLNVMPQHDHEFDTLHTIKELKERVWLLEEIIHELLIYASPLPKDAKQMAALCKGGFTSELLPRLTQLGPVKVADRLAEIRALVTRPDSGAISADPAMGAISEVGAAISADPAMGAISAVGVAISDPKKDEA